MERFARLATEAELEAEVFGFEPILAFEEAPPLPQVAQEPEPQGVPAAGNPVLAGTMRHRNPTALAFQAEGGPFARAIARLGWSGPALMESGQYEERYIGSDNPVLMPVMVATPAFEQWAQSIGLEAAHRDLGWGTSDNYLIARGLIVDQFSERPTGFERVMNVVADVGASLIITGGISAAISPLVAAAELPAVVSQVVTRAATSTVYAAATDRPIDVGDILESAIKGQLRSEVFQAAASIFEQPAPVFEPLPEYEPLPPAIELPAFEVEPIAFEELAAEVLMPPPAVVFEPAPVLTFEPAPPVVELPQVFEPLPVFEPVPVFEAPAVTLEPLPPVVELPRVFEPVPVFEPAQPIVVEPVPVVEAAPELEPPRVEPPVIQAPIEVVTQPEPAPPVPVLPVEPPAIELAPVELDLPLWAFEGEPSAQLIEQPQVFEGLEQWQIDAPELFEVPTFPPPQVEEFPMFEDFYAYEAPPAEAFFYTPEVYEPPAEYFAPYEAPPAEAFYYTPPEVYGSADVTVEPPPVSFGGEERLPTDLPPYEYGAPQAPEAPIPTVTYTPPAPTSREWSVEQVIKNVTSAATAAIGLVRAWETRKLPPNPVARATDAQGRTVLAKGDGMVYTRDTQGRVTQTRPQVGLPQSTIEGFVVVNNGDGTFTRIRPDGTRETLRYPGAAPTAGGAGVGLLVVAGIAAFALMG